MECLIQLPQKSHVAESGLQLPQLSRCWTLSMRLDCQCAKGRFAFEHLGEAGPWPGYLNVLLLSTDCVFAFVLLHNLYNSRTDNQEDLSCLTVLFSWEGGELSVGLWKDCSESLLRDSGTKGKLWRSSKESDVAVLWDSCRILFIQLNCISLLQTLELASCLLWPVQLVKLASSSFSQKTHMVGGFSLWLLSVLW